MGAYFTISSIIYIAIFSFYFFQKNSVKTIETKIYKILLVTTFVGLCLDALSFFVYKNGTDPSSFLYQTLAKGMLVYFLVWIGSFTYYIFAISHNDPDEDNEIKLKKFRKTLRVFMTIIMFIAFVLPISFNIKNDVIFPIGFGVDLTYLTVGFCLILCFYFAFKNYKHILLRKYTPLFMMVVLVVITLLVQKIFPELFLVNFSISIVVILLYFYIENPDIKIIQELTYSKELLKRSNNATARSLSILNKEIAKPMEVLHDFGNKKIDYDNYEETLKEIKELQRNSIKLVDQINGVIELSKLENDNYGLNNNNYDTKELFEEIRHLLIAQNDNNNIKLTTEFDRDISNVLYGDSNKIKQTITAIYNYLIENCKMNKVLFKINDTNTKNTCRLRFSFVLKKQDNYDKLFDKDGIEAEIINRLLELQNAKLEINVFDDEMNIDILINQKRVLKYEVEFRKNKEVMVEYFDCKQKKVLIVDDNKEKINYLIDLLKPYNLNIEVAYNYFEYEEKIYNNKWNLILLDDMMPDTNKFEFFNLNDLEKGESLRNIENLSNEKLPLVVMITPNTEIDDEIKYDYLLKPINNGELDKIIRKYMK